MEIWSEYFELLDDMIGCNLVDLFWIWFAGSLWCKLQDDQWRFAMASVLLPPLLGPGSKSTSLSAGIHMWVQVLRYVFFLQFFLAYSSMFILSLPIIDLGSNATSLRPGFCVRRPRQQDTIFCEWNLISWFFAFCWLLLWVDGINKFGWCVAGGRGCCVKDWHQIPSVSWIFHHSLLFHIY